MKKSFSTTIMHRIMKSGLQAFLMFLFLQIGIQARAQAPQRFSFQGVARDGSGQVIANTSIGYSYSIHEGSAGGQVLYLREGTVSTNSVGIFNLTIGTEANPLPPTIKWGQHAYFLQMGIDPDGAVNGFTFIDMGTTQLISVPYSLYSDESGKWKDNDPILHKGTFGQGLALQSVGNGSRLLWHPGKAAFRAGEAANNYWDNAEIGDYSFAVGRGTRANRNASIAMGYASQATDTYAVAIGDQSYATAAWSVALGTLASADGTASVAIGSEPLSSGLWAISIGHKTVSKAEEGIALGAYNDISDNPSNSSLPADRLFQLGNGTAINRSNALTVLRNGNVGIGNNALSPQFLLDIGGRARIRHNAASAGLYFDNSQNVADAFVGLKQDDQIGFYINGGWRFWVNGSAAYVNGAIVNVSDRRLKKDISPFTNSLSMLGSLQGYHYYWKDKQQGSDLQTGLMAQEVEKYFPELVVTDKNGYKAVNYTGLIPHLIEAMKALDQKTAKLSALVDQLSTASTTSSNASK